MKDQFLLFILLFSGFTLNSQCFPDRHNTSEATAWTSCELSQNPNPVRGNSHWIRYNLNALYSLGQMNVWNYNHPSNLDRGLKEIVIDYTTDGITWTEWGTYTLEQATGSSTYEGDLGPDLNGLEAKDILITALSNYGDGSCFALSELKIDVIEVISNTEDVFAQVEVSLSPNPASELINVSLRSEELKGTINYTIMNSDGKVLYRDAIQKNSSVVEHSINVSTFPAGMYFIEFVSENGKATESFSVIHK